jgi:hypothetical protein
MFQLWRLQLRAVSLSVVWIRLTSLSQGPFFHYLQLDTLCSVLQYICIVLGNLAPFSPVYVNLCSWGMCCLHQGTLFDCDDSNRIFLATSVVFHPSTWDYQPQNSNLPIYRCKIQHNFIVCSVITLVFDLYHKVRLCIPVLIYINCHNNFNIIKYASFLTLGKTIHSMNRL